MGLKEDLDILDTKINKLKVDYEQYFVKVLKRPPSALRDEIDRIILKYSNQPITSTYLKFRYTAITNKYTSYKQFWNRILRQIEEGTYVRGASGARLPEEPIKAAIPQQRVEAAAPPPSSGSDSKFKAVYKQFVEAKKSCSEPAEDMPYDKFEQAIKQQTEKIKRDLKCNDVEYKVTVKDGKPKITLVPKK